ncbi:tetratricopeptide repeat protein [Nocardia aurea]|uniref:Tetratricopeptide repeat protein n=1 Tax=Nocardia aurea TaxID=2144174 RepID=A0ABV3G4C6_9NOCA
MNPQVEKARVLIGLKRPEAARALLSTVLAGEPDHAEAHAHLANSWYATGDYDRALDCAEAALRNAPTYEFAWRIKALAESQLASTAAAGDEASERSARARAAGLRCVQLDPESSENQRILAMVTMDVDLAAALEIITHAIELDPENADLYVLRGYMLRQFTGAVALAEAERVLHEALRLDPDNADALYELASVDLAAGRRDSAMSRLRQVAEWDPSRAAAVRVGLAMIENDMAQLAAAEHTAAQDAAHGHAEPRRSPIRRPVVLVLVALAVVGNIVSGVILSEGDGSDSDGPKPTRVSPTPHRFPQTLYPSQIYVPPSFPRIPPTLVVPPSWRFTPPGSPPPT